MHIGDRTVCLTTDEQGLTDRFGTHASLGITRRMLIAAVSSARQMYLVSSSAEDEAVDSMVDQASGRGADEKT